MLNDTFDPLTLADDLVEVRRIYARYFNTLTDSAWVRPARLGPNEWNVQHTVAHLCALTGAGLDSIKYTLRGDLYRFKGLSTRWQFNDFNRCGIEEHLHLSRPVLCAEFLDILDQSALIAAQLQPGQAEITSEMPIYNRPVKIIEALSIIMFHAALHHSAQVTEPAGVPPLWQQLSPAIRHRVIGRVMRAFSLLYRYDLGGSLNASFVFKVGGPGGGSWHIDVSPTSATSEEGAALHPSLTLNLQSTDVFCHLLTGRFNLTQAVLTGQFRPWGDLRLFPRMSSLFSVDARN